MAFVQIITFFGLINHIVSGTPLQTSQGPIDVIPTIVGGIDAPKGHAPHMMALVSGEWIAALMCGASIISDSHILTAAHCIDAFVIWDNSLSQSLYGAYGSNEWQSTDRKATFTHYINHELWDPIDIKNDIGVLFLSNRLSDGEHVRLIPLEWSQVDAGHTAYVTGWGRLWAWGPIPAKLQLIYLETMDEKSCNDAVQEASQGWWVPPVDQNIEICTRHPKGAGFGVCNGDSGSALVSTTTGRQIGIVSWGFPCARGAPDMFVRIGGFRPWLLNILLGHDENKTIVSDSEVNSL